MDLITSLTSDAIHKALDGLGKRHEAIAGNMANVETPGYKKRDVQFEAALDHAIQKSRGSGSGLPQADNSQDLPMIASNPYHFQVGNSPSSIGEVQTDVEESDEGAFRNDGNGVDLESQMASLARNTEHYVALTKISSMRTRTLRSIITNNGS